MTRVETLMSAVPAIDPGDPLCVGGVAFTSIADAGDGSVTVTVADPACGDPCFRVYNPPALVPDPAGTIDRGGVMYRSDPLAALAHVVASNGGKRR